MTKFKKSLLSLLTVGAMAAAAVPAAFAAPNILHYPPQWIDLDVEEVKAPETIEVTVPDFDITINEVKVNNLNSKYPFLLYKGVTYVPMTFSLTQFAGLNIRFDERYETGDIAFFVGNSGVYADELDCYVDEKIENDADTYVAKIVDYQVAVNDIRDEYFLLAEDNTWLYLPVVNFRGVTYLPLTNGLAFAFDWECSFDAENGLVIETRNSYRPVWDEFRIYHRFNMINVLYNNFFAVNADDYVGYHELTFDDQTTLLWGRRGVGEVVVDLTDELLNDPSHAPILFWDRQGEAVELADYEPVLEGNMFYIRCVGIDDSAKFHTYDLSIDLAAAKIVDIDEVFIGPDGVELGSAHIDR